MRLRRLDLTRYGKFTERSLDFGASAPGEPDFHIVYGLNEAGKSTAFAAYLDLLFGIEERSRYNFLHAYPAMEVGACLEFDGASHDLVRRKLRAGSLLDPSGRPVGETLLAGALSGLTRDAYRTMFSLDDETLERGGDAILQSKGDLGELLFSASAGLAEVSAVLAELGEEAGRIHRKKAQSTEIAGLKHRLRELKGEREAIDTAVSAFASLRAGLARASETYEATMAETAEVKARLDRARRLLRAHPLAVEQEDLGRDLARHAGLPRPPADWSAELPGLMVAQSRLETRREGVAEAIARLGAEIGTITVDEALLAEGEAIRSLVERRGRFAGAAEDLPQRRLALASAESAIAGLVDALGRPAEGDASALVLPAPVAGALRELIETRSGIEARQATAEREWREASERLRQAREGEERAAGADAAGEAELRAVEVVLRRLRQGETAARRRLAEQDLARQHRRVAEAIEALAPWSGDAARLRALNLPEARRIEAWRARAGAIERRQTGHRDRRRALAEAMAEGEARLAGLRMTVGAIDDAEAARLRAARDAAWTAHLERLDEGSARHFATALEADDRLTDDRLRQAALIADLRAAKARLDDEHRAAAREAALETEAETEAAALLAEIDEALPLDLGWTAETPVETRLDRIAGWSRRRDEALGAFTLLADGEAELEGLDRTAERDREALAKALARCGESGDGLTLPDLVALAEALLTRQTAEQAERLALTRRVGEAEAALATRREDRDAANAEAATWDRRWREALAATWMPADQPLSAVREVLSVLDRLPALLRERNEARRRIASLEEECEAFVLAVAGLCRRLGHETRPEAPEEAARDLGLALERAERARDARRERLAERDRLCGEAEAIAADLERQGQRKAELTAFFAVATLDEVNSAVAACAERDRIEVRRAELARRILGELRAASLDEALAELATGDLPAVEREEAELAARLDDLEARRQAAFGERTRAEDRLAAVGGDDAVARLETERRTALLRIEEAALRYLRLRTGALVAQGALRVYRDKHQSSMMNRASEAFAAMTRGDYAGLSTRSDKDRETLIGLAREGGSKLAADMSKGTRFQLYLALRLAGYREFATARRAVPFVADDIMETFDEPRSTEVLRLLAEMSRLGQVVYLTHHRHICDIAASVEPGVRIHRL
ncbi:sugar translocase [Aureimonas endophytica]|uniref:Sugar translocase n=1 Tax=Aureimonas endophytica TaxID=2027858 RepID=A0A916ZFD7_9HYPH|nr:AAA family ATPase [Aureimonas endophytica]GGD91687.1 sugar translocase [Aureimonas endophytica]